MLARHRHTQHRHQGLGREHPRQMRRATRPSNDQAHATIRGALGEREHVVRHAMRRQHLRIVADAELIEHLGSVLERLPVAGGAHDDGDGE